MCVVGSSRLCRPRNNSEYTIASAKPRKRLLWARCKVRLETGHSIGRCEPHQRNAGWGFMLSGVLSRGINLGLQFRQGLRPFKSFPYRATWHGNGDRLTRSAGPVCRWGAGWRRHCRKISRAMKSANGATSSNRKVGNAASLTSWSAATATMYGSFSASFPLSIDAVRRTSILGNGARL